jgi:DNA-binding MarR family transcriptional regulator
MSENTDQGRTLRPEIAAKVDEVLNGNVLSYLTNTVQRTVMGQGNKAGVQLIILTGCQRGLKNGHGIYPLFNGDPEGGKTWLVRQTLWAFPPEIVEDSGMSPQAIYYDNLDGIPRIYYVDDFNALNEDLKSSLKQVLTNFRRPTKRKVPNTKTHTTDTMIVPARTVLIFTSVDSIGDVQMMSRLYQCPPEEGNGIKDKIWEYTLASGAGEIPDLDAVVDDDVEVCREVLRQLIDPAHPLEVIIPFIREIEWKDPKKARNFNVFFDLIRLSALLEQRHRKHDLENGVIEANYEDFYRACSIFEPRRLMTATKLSKGPQRVYDYLRDHPNVGYKGYTQTELVEKLKVDQGNLSKWLTTLTEMTLVVKDRDLRDRTREKTIEDTNGNKRKIEDATPVQLDVWRYVGDPITTSVFDAPIQLSENEREKKEYQEWRQDWLERTSAEG